MNELKIIIKAVTADAQKSMQEVKKELQGISKEAKSTSDKFGTAMKGIAKATTIAITAITAIVAAIVALGKSTLDFQKQAAQLNAAFGAMGKSAADAASVYKGFFRFLGESDQAIEASNLLIKLTQDEANLTQWTKILQGVYATFPDSLPIEALVESANETARVGVVTGNLADALNWAGENEDAFNEKLAQTTSLSEREALIRNTLNSLYGTAADIYERNNQALLEYNESQADFQQKSAELGATITPLLTYLNQLGSAIVSLLKPAFETILPYIAGFVMWLTEAINRVAVFAGIMSSSGESVTAVGEATAKATAKAGAGVNTVNNGLKDMKKNAEAARKAAMGFDELNIVPNPENNSSSITGGTGALDGLDMSGLTNNIADLTGSLDEFKAKAEEAKNAISQWMEEWGWVLGTIAGILAALSIRNLLVQMASLVGLGEQAAKVLSFSGAAAGIKKLIGWLGAVIGLMKEGNSFWAVMGAAFPKLAAAFTKVGGAIATAAKAVAAFIGGLAGWQIALIIAAIAALASGIVFLAKNWDEVTAKVKEFCQLNLVPILEEFKNTFAELWGAIQELGAAFANLGVSIYNALPDWLQDWLYNVWEGIKNVCSAIWEWVKSVDWLGVIGTAIEGLGAIVVGIIGGVIMGAIQAVLNLVESAVQIITGAIQIISGILGAFANLIAGIFSGDFSKCLDSVELIWEGIKNVFKGAADAVIGTVWGFIEGIIDFFVHMWDVLVGHSIVPDTIEAIIEWFAYLPIKVFELVAGFVQGVIDFFANLASKLGEWAVTIWNNIKAAFEGVPEWFSEKFTAAWQGIQTAWATVVEWFGNVWEGISNAFASAGEWFTNLFTAAWEGIKTAWSSTTQWFADVWQNISTTYSVVADWFTDMFSQAWAGIQNAWANVTQWFANIWSSISNTFSGAATWFTDLFTRAWQGIQNAWSSVKSWFSNLWSGIQTTYSNVGSWFSEKFQTARTNVNNAFSNVGSWFGSRWSDIKNAMSSVGSWFSSTFSTAYTNTTNAFKNAKTGFANVWSNIKAGFGNVSDWFKTTFTNAWTAVKNVFSSGGKIFDGIKDGILEGLKAVINKIIEGINKVIKTPFDGINSALKSIKNVEIVGIKPFSWLPTISVPQIPKLAKGGIVDEATLALIGERGKEAVVPLENNTEWIDKLVDKLTSRQEAPSKIVLMLDGKELGWANINSINNITRQTGALQLTLV